MRVPVWSQEGEVVGEMDLPSSVFGVRVSPDLLHQVVTMYLANRRVGTASTLTRGEVRGGGRKPWPQKGTGRARQGSIRAPHWRKGGIVFGPQPRDYRYAVPKKARRLALLGALSEKAETGEVRVLEGLHFPEPRTKRMRGLLEKMGVDGSSALIVVSAPDPVIYKSARNLPGVSTRVARDLNAYDVLRHRVLVLTREAISSLESLGRGEGS